MKRITCLGLVGTLVLGACGGGAFLAKDSQHSPSPMSAMAPEAVAGAVGEVEHDTEDYSHIAENPFLNPGKNPLSTFSVDVDTASYSNVRRFLAQGSLPPKDAVRVEELINYFEYDYPDPTGDQPFSVTTEVSAAPWKPEHKLVHIGLQGKRMAAKDMPPRNLTFLLDVSGSMGEPNKLPLLKRSLKEVVENMSAKDSIAVVVYAGASGLVLPPTRASERTKILDALERLEAGGSTNGGEGIQLAYETAQRSFDPRGINRVILATDGDFNVGISSRGELERLITEKRESGVFLTVLGFGMGNLKDATLETLAAKGNGNYAYIDDIAEARKVLVQQAGSTFVTIAKDVKIQVELNPRWVQAYRLIGYENRLMRAEDFNDDKKDAGDIGAGHSVTALYEIVPVGAASPAGDVDPLKYQKPAESSDAAKSNEMLTVKLRFKRPAGTESALISHTVGAEGKALSESSRDFRFAASVAAFGMLLRGSEHKGNASWELVRSLTDGTTGSDAHGYRREYLAMVARAAKLAKPTATVAR